VIPLLAEVNVGPALVGQHAAKTLIVVVVLLIGFRLTGKRELSQFNVYDLAMLMALSNAVQNAMTGGLGSLPVGLATSSTVVATAWVISRFLSRRARLEPRVLGSPILLVRDGRVMPSRLKRGRVTREELDEACRSRGLASPRDAALAVLEIDGSISVIPAERSRADRWRPPRRPRTRRAAGPGQAR